MAFKITLVVFFLLMCLITFAGSTSEKETADSRRNYAALSGIMGLLVITSAVLIK